MDLALLESISIKNGSHNSRERGMCVMEAVAYIAGEPHSDHPKCACPIITCFMIRLNDRMPDDATRSKWLKPLIPKIIGTRKSKADGCQFAGFSDAELKRGFLCADWTVREATPL